jgi:hypothetical protein
MRARRASRKFTRALLPAAFGVWKQLPREENMAKGKADSILREVVCVRELREDPEIALLFPGDGSLNWELRERRGEYVKAGALFLIAGRLFAHRPTFKRVVLEIGARRLAESIPR